jgi:hypothetical protein
MSVERVTVDLSAYPDLVMILLGMRVNAATGLKTLLGFGPQIAKVPQDTPDGLLSHEIFLWSLFPPHAGIRQYWRDLAALETWSRAAPHSEWWKTFLRNSGGTGFWHETYFMRGGVEAIFDDIPKPIGLMRFAPRRAAKGSMFTARQRAAALNSTAFADRPMPSPVITEEDLIAGDEHSSRGMS